MPLKKQFATEMGADVFILFIRCKRCNNEMMVKTDLLNGKYASYGGCKEVEEKNKLQNNINRGNKIKIVKFEYVDLAEIENK